MLAYRVEALHQFHPPSTVKGHIPSPGGVPMECHYTGMMLSGEVVHDGVMVAADSVPPKIMGSQLGIGVAGADRAWWLLAWGCGSQMGSMLAP